MNFFDKFRKDADLTDFTTAYLSGISDAQVDLVKLAAVASEDDDDVSELRINERIAISARVAKELQRRQVPAAAINDAYWTRPDAA